MEVAERVQQERILGLPDNADYAREAQIDREDHRQTDFNPAPNGWRVFDRPVGVVTGGGGSKTLAPRSRPADPSTRTSAAWMRGSAFTLGGLLRVGAFAAVHVE